jgi:plasmid stabilization system protein ParE
VKIEWTRAARGDVDRLGDFIAADDPYRAREVEQMLGAAPRKLLDFPRRGAPVSEFESRHVREFRVGAYLLRYELSGDAIYVLRFFHGREDRP